MPEANDIAAARRARRAAGRTRGTDATRKRTAEALQTNIRTVAFRGNEDAAHSIVANPNTGKRHAAKLDNTPRLTPRQYAPGATRASQRHYYPTLETRFARIPSLGSTLTKRPLKP